MSHLKRPNDAIHWFLNELTARVVAKSGLPQDRFHLGKIILQSLQDAPNFESQIDGATGISMTNQEVLERSVRCATAFKNCGLGVGDVIVLMAPNHVDLAIPFYAALYMGIAVAPVDRTFTINELPGIFNINKPKIIFCQSEKAPDVQLSLNSLGSDAKTVSFDGGDDVCSFDDFLNKCADENPFGRFRPQDFDPEETIAFLTPTSGTTGVPKTAAATHKNFFISGFNQWTKFSKFPTPTRMALTVSPLQWTTAITVTTISPILMYTRLQTSAELTPEHAFYLINKYKPTNMMINPILMTTLINSNGEKQKCDFSCFEEVLLTGSAVSPELIAEVKRLSSNSGVHNGYGMTELSGPGFHFPESPTPPGSCGQPLGCHFYRIVDVETQKDISKPMLPGELWISGPAVFKEYYNDPEATADAFAEGKWFKTGDLFYRDEHWNFFFVERIKNLLKYKNNQISPAEVEAVIRQHPGVMDVAVSGVPDPECGDLAVACVVRKSGSQVTAQEIKDLVKESLADSKQLRGGVIFLDALPMTATAKIHRKKIKEIVLHTPKE